MFSFLFFCCFVPSLYNLLFKNKIFFLDKERIDGNTTRGSLSISFIICVLQSSYTVWKTMESDLSHFQACMYKKKKREYGKIFVSRILF